MDMVSIAKETVQTVVSQVPLMVQNALLGVMNVAPLQLKGPASSQPALMLTEGTTTPQGSGNSTRAGSSRKRQASPSHMSAPKSSEKQRSLSPPNTLADFEAITMDADDELEPTGSPAAG
jgi:hypothetical protein